MEISYSNNVFIPVTNLCRNRCSYCGFRRNLGRGSWFMSPEEVMSLAKLGKAAGCAEALITLGEKPEVYNEVKDKLSELGHESIVEYLSFLCEKILKIGLLPHTNAGALSKRELRRLRQYNASMGLMLECVAKLPAHAKSPGKDPELRLKTIEAAGELRIPFTTGLLIGIGEDFRDRVRSLLAIRELHERYGHIQEVIIQPFEPKAGTPMGNCKRPSMREILTAVAAAREIMPSMNIQVPPNLLTDGSPMQRGLGEFGKAVAASISAGANDFGGISTVTPDFINPDRPWPSVAALRTAVELAGFRLRERLPIYPQYVKDKRFMSEEVRRRVLDLADDDGYRAG
jgi:FO synthase subunit 1